MKRLKHVAGTIVMAVSILIIMSLCRTQFIPLLAAFSASFLIYALIIQKELKWPAVKFWIVVAILLRLITLFFFPQLSDDIYRFIWDGQLMSQGINPFHQLPNAYVNAASNSVTVDPVLFEKLNSPDYFSVYPPYCQFLFWLGASVFPYDWFIQSLFLKSTILLAEIGSIALIVRILKRLEKPSHWVLVYALNPLVIVELCGNIHFEGWMIFFLLAGYAAYLNQKPISGGIFFAFGFITKLIPAILAPFFIRRLSIKQIINTIILGLGTVIFAFLPFMNQGFSDHFGNSLNLYFQKFEYNASIYYLFRWIGYQIFGYNQIQFIGPLLAAMFVIFVIIFLLKEKKPSWFSFPMIGVFVLAAYFFLGTTVHPWYITTIVAFAALTHWRFPIIWSYMIFLTYINYRIPEFNEDLIIVALEYIIVIIFGIFEWKKNQLPSKLHKNYLL